MSLTLILGPMFSGKTSKMLEYYRKFKIKSNCMIFNHYSDRRYSDDDKLFTHNLIYESATFIHNIKDIYKLKNYKDIQVLFIDEGQFFEDLHEVINIINRDNKVVFISGLKGDYKNNSFSNISNLIPHCDDLIMLKAICIKCEEMKDAIFSKKINPDNNIIDIGSSDKYIPVCRKHF
jgi:thymidine kinase